MVTLEKLMNSAEVDLVIWDLDGVIYTLDWFYENSPAEFLALLADEITKIDVSIIKDRSEFLARRFPYPEINEVGMKYGKEAQLQVKSLYLHKEMAAIERAIPHPEVIEFIKHLNKPQAVWSNNYAKTIEYLLEKAGVANKIEVTASLDKVVLSKPDKEGFNLIQSHFPTIQPGRMVLVGDSLVSDKVAAVNAGIKFYHY